MNISFITLGPCNTHTQTISFITDLSTAAVIGYSDGWKAIKPLHSEKH
jgi:hypothetical protein